MSRIKHLSNLRGLQAALVCLAVLAVARPGAAPAAAWVNVTGNVGGEQWGAYGVTYVQAVPGSNEVIAGVSERGLWITGDGGATWRKLGGDEMKFRPGRIVFDPKNTSVFWVSGCYGDAPFKTEDGGKTFRRLGKLAHADGVAVDSADPARKTLLLGLHEQSQSLQLSRDGGNTWMNIGANLPADSNHSTDPIVIDAQTFLINTAGWKPKATLGIYRTEDGGRTWTQVSTYGPQGPALVASDGAIYWQRLWGGGLLKSTDQGRTWKQISHAVKDNPIELPGNRLAALADAQIMISSDGGATWSKSGPPVPVKPNGITYSDKGKCFYAWRLSDNMKREKQSIVRLNLTEDELEVAKVRRISHPGYAAGQCTFGIRDPWNYDRSRLMYSEGGKFTGKQPYYYWSPVVWGFVSELKHWKTAEEYERARKHVNEDQHFGFSANLWWSIFPGEENIMYAAHLAGKNVVRFNVDTEQMSVVCSYDPGDGRDLSHVRVMGWTTDAKLIVTLGDNNGDVIPEKGGWEIDVKTKQRTYVPVAGDDYSRWPAIGSHGHGTFSPNRSLYFRCGANELRALPSQKLIRTLATWEQSPPFSLEHLSWRASNDWFTAESGGPEWNRIAAKTGKWPTQPMLDKITIYQIWTDGTIKPLLSTVTACAWSGKDGAQHWNYEGEPIPDHRRDGRQLIFPSYEGVYSRDDHEAFGSAPWGYCGLFLADLVPAAGNDDMLAPSKPAMLNAAFDSSSRSIRLTWARGTDNVGVDGYNVYRDGEKIATTGFIDYTDTIKDPVSASYRYSVGAVDVAGNEARSSEITVRVAR